MAAIAALGGGAEPPLVVGVGAACSDLLGASGFG
jgi:hypothetical protein